MGQIQNLEDLLNFLRRRLWLIVSIAVIGILVSAIYAKSRPDSYEAAAVIEVRGAQVADNAATGSAQVLQSIEQRLTTRENLQAVIDRHGLYADLPGLAPDGRLALLRRNITFDSIASAGNSPYGASAQISAIIITARDGDPELAARIANDFAQGVLDMSATNKQTRTRDTLDFYREEETRISGLIAGVESEIAAYKNEQGTALPAIADTQRDEIVGLDSDIRDLDQRLVALLEEQRQLAAKGTLRATEQRRLQDIDGEVAVLTEQKSALVARRENLIASLAEMPEVERALAGYQRQLDQLQGSLDLVSAKLAEAETEAKLATRQQGERFALLDRAITPENPVGAGGKKLFMAGSFVSLLGGIGLAFLLDLLKPIVRTSTQLERQLGLRPIVSIPELNLPTRKRTLGGGPGARDVAQRVLALPRFVLVCSAMTAVLFVAAALS